MRHVIPSASLSATVALAGSAGAQSPVPSAPGAQARIGYATVAALRAGVGPAVHLPGRKLRPDTSATGSSSVRRRVVHAGIGAGLGLLTGGVVGAEVVSREDNGDAISIPPAAAGAVIGGVIGFVVGAAAGAAVP